MKTRSFILWIASALGCAGALSGAAELPATCPAIQPATQPADAIDPRWRQIQETQRNAMRNHWSDSPVVQTLPMDALIHLSMSNGMLKAETTGLWAATPMRVAVENSKAFWVIGRARAMFPANITNSVSLIRYDFDAGDDELWNCRVNITDRAMSFFAQSMRRSVILTQLAGAVTVRVSEYGKFGQGMKLILDAHAPSLVHLRGREPEGFRRYVLPLLSKFGEPVFLRPAAGDVYGVFDEIPADQKVVQEMTPIIEDLDADDPADRDAANARLRQLGTAGVLAAFHIDRSGLSEEQKLRLDAFADGYRRRAITNPAIERQDIAFLVDCLEYDDPAVRAAAKTELERQTHGEVDFDIALNGAAAERATDVLRRKLFTPPPLSPVPATQPAPQA